MTDDARVIKGNLVVVVVVMMMSIFEDLLNH